MAKLRRESLRFLLNSCRPIDPCGTNLTEEWRSRGHEVWACDILPGEDPQHRKADVSDYQQMVVILRKQKDAAVDRCDSLSDVVASLQDRGTRLL